MSSLRPMLGALALGLLLVADGSAQIPRGGGGRSVEGGVVLPPLTSPCPACEKIVEPPAGKPASFECPHCKAKIQVAYNADGYTLTVNENNKMQKWLIYGGIALGVIGVIGVILKNTVFAAPKPKKKKKRRDDDEDDEEEDDEDDRPRKQKRRPRDDDE